MRVYKPSGIEWLGEIPQSWKNVSIRSCFTESNQRCNDDSYPLLSVTIANGIIYQDDIENKKDISNDDKSNYKIVPLNAVAYNKMRMWQGAVGVNTLTIGIVSPAYIVAIPNEKILPNFVSYLFKSKIMIGEFDKNSYGLCLDMNNLRYDDFRSLKIPLPPLQEQKQIANFLDEKCEKIQNYINKKQKLITLLQEKKQALINEAVCGRMACHTDLEQSEREVSTMKSRFFANAQNDKNRDFSHSLKMTISYKNSGIDYLGGGGGKIPKHWEIKKAKGIFKEVKRSIKDNDEIITCFRDGIVTLRKNRRTEGFTNSLKEIGYQGIRVNDLVIHSMDAFAGAIGVSDSNGKATPVYVVCVPRYDNLADNKYYAYLLRNVANSGFILSLAKGIRERSTEFKYNDFADLKILLPPLQEQKQIANFLDEKCEKINSAIEKTKRQITLIKEYKNTLINEAVCGRVDFSHSLKMTKRKISKRK